MKTNIFKKWISEDTPLDEIPLMTVKVVELIWKKVQIHLYEDWRYFVRYKWKELDNNRLWKEIYWNTRSYLAAVLIFEKIVDTLRENEIQTMAYPLDLTFNRLQLIDDAPGNMERTIAQYIITGNGNSPQARASYEELRENYRRTLAILREPTRLNPLHSGAVLTGGTPQPYGSSIFEREWNDYSIRDHWDIYAPYTNDYTVVTQREYNMLSNEEKIWKIFLVIN